MSCCNSGLAYSQSAAGSSRRAIPLALIALVGVGKDGDRARICCCLTKQNKELKKLLRRRSRTPEDPVGCESIDVSASGYEGAAFSVSASGYEGAAFSLSEFPVGLLLPVRVQELPGCRACLTLVLYTEEASQLVFTEVQRSSSGSWDTLSETTHTIVPGTVPSVEISKLDASSLQLRVSDQNGQVVVVSMPAASEVVGPTASVTGLVQSPVRGVPLCEGYSEGEYEITPGGVRLPDGTFKEGVWSFLYPDRSRPLFLTTPAETIAYFSEEGSEEGIIEVVGCGCASLIGLPLRQEARRSLFDLPGPLQQ